MDNLTLAQVAQRSSAGKVEQAMFHHHWRSISALIPLSLLVLVVGCGGQPAASTKFSDQSFPTDEFFGGISVDLDQLQEHPRYRLFPLDKLIPANTSFDYLDNELISQFAIFLKHCGESERGGDQRFEIATVAKLRNPDSFDVKTELAKWSNLTTPWRTEHEIEVEEIQVEGKSCFQFESGTILNSIRRPGKIQFYDRNGKATTNGVNVGQLSKRGFITGGDNKSRAVISVSGFSDSDLIDGSVIVDLHLDAFRTSKLDLPFPESQIYLLASDGKTCSKPVDFDTKSFFVHRFTFPRKLPVLDAESREPKGTVDLVDEFATDGELQIVLRCLEKSSYLGIQDSDFGLRIPGHEYLGVIGEYVVVTQSLESLKQIMKMDQKAIAEKIALKDGLQAAASFDLAKPENRIAFEDLLKSLELQHVLSAMSSTTQRVQCSISMDQQQIFSAKIGMSADDARSKAKQISMACKKLTTTRLLDEIDGFGYKPNDESERLGSALATEVYYSMLRQDTTASLRELGGRLISGMPFETTSEAIDRVEVPRFPDNSVDREFLGESFQTLAETLEKSVRVTGDSNGLAIGFLWPFDEAGEIDQTELLMLAALRRYRSHEHFLMKRFHLSEQMERRLISEFPDNKGLWTSLAHQLSFNTSMDFNGEPTQYFWVRKGIEVLLDVADSNKNSTDAVWEAAKYIGSKIGASDEQEAYRKLFASDKALLDRVGNYVDLEQCRDDEGNVNCELVAHGMMVHCLDQIRETKKAESSIAEFEMEVQPALMRGRHARWLDNQFDNRAATAQWRKVLEKFLELGEMDPEDASWHESKLAEIQMRLSPAGQEVFAFYSKARGFQDAQDVEQTFLQIESALGLVQKFVDEDQEQIEIVQNVFKDLLEKAKSQLEQLEKPIPTAYHDLFQKPSGAWPLAPR